MHINNESFLTDLKTGSRVVIAALVPARGDEDQEVVDAVTQVVTASGARMVGTLI